MSLATGFSESVGPGVGQGLGVSVCLDPTVARNAEFSTTSEFGWGGMASTCFSIDPDTGLVFVFLTQLVPSSATPARSQVKWLATKLYGGHSV